jgi:hypothetical protein
MSDTTKTLGELTALELLQSARHELTGLVELAQKLADGTNTYSKEDLDLYIGAYQGGIAARIAVAESKIDKTGVLTKSDASAVAAIIDAAVRSTKVARVLERGEVAVGTARSIGDENGIFLDGKTDVRDGYLRVTLLSGFEAFWPVRELLPLVHTGEFVVDYQV